MIRNNGKRSIAIIPCYNEEFTISSVIIKAKNHVNEVLVIDDGSVDDTAKIALKVGATVIKHKTNKGKSAGIKTGFKYALEKKFDYIITLDGDAQHNPDEIPVLLKTIKENGHDIVLGIRFGKYTEMPLWRKMGKRVLDYTTSIGNGGFITDSQCGFRAFNNKAVKALFPNLNGDSFSVESEQLIKAHDLGLKIENKLISCKYKDLDTSTKKPTSHGFSVLVNILKIILLKHPLILLSIPGILSVFIGLLMGVITLKLYADTYIFDIGLAIVMGIFLIIGASALFIALSLDSVSIFLKKILSNKNKKYF